MTARRPFPKPSGAKYVPVIISAMDTALISYLGLVLVVEYVGQLLVIMLLLLILGTEMDNIGFIQEILAEEVIQVGIAMRNI